MNRKFKEECPRTGAPITAAGCDACNYPESFDGGEVECLFGEEDEAHIIERHHKEDRQLIADSIRWSEQ